MTQSGGPSPFSTRYPEPVNRTWNVLSFYEFRPLSKDALESMKADMKSWLSERDVIGHILISTEGINATIAGGPDDVSEFKSYISELGFAPSLKESVSDIPPYRSLRVEIRREIVGMKRTDLVPSSPENRHLTAQQWHKMLNDVPRPLVIDTRNRYETRLGVFRDAVDPDIGHFSEWGAYADRTNFPEDRPIMIYCTGGIRCEKVMIDLERRGLENVYQLRDGILGYLAEYPTGDFEGECFVFDERVALDANLQPTAKFGICPGCGEPAEATQTCIWCDGRSFVCALCEPTWGSPCSKTCRDRFERHGKADR